MSSALWIGTTGLTASSKQMDVIGNNLANSNTLGFKAGNTYFASMLNQSLSGFEGISQRGSQRRLACALRSHKTYNLHYNAPFFCCWGR